MSLTAIFNVTKPALITQNFCGQQLINWSVLSCLNSSLVEKIIILYPLDAPEPDLPENSKITVRTRLGSGQVNQEILETISEEITTSHILLLDGSFPFLTNQLFKDAFDSKVSGFGLISGCELQHPVWIDGQSTSPAEEVMVENGAFSLYEKSNLLTEWSNVHFLEMPFYPSLSLDAKKTFRIAESIFEQHFSYPKKEFNIKLFITDVDGVLTDAGMYYSESGDELKKFNTHDGKGLQLLREAGVKTGIITSENTEMVARRAKKLKIDHVYQGKTGNTKLESALEICAKEGIDISETAYIGDDVNCFELLSNAGLAACPANALPKIKGIPGIIHIRKKGGEGAVREFIEYIMTHTFHS